MADSPFLGYWQQQHSSGQRYNHQTFYKRKAAEHIRFLADHGLNNTPVADLGCGFGEILLALLQSGLNISEATDFNDTAVASARAMCINHPLNIFRADAMEYVTSSRVKTLIACQSLNQYLDGKLLGRFLRSFAHNDAAQSLVLFDTIDPLRWNLTLHLSRYDSCFELTKLKALLLLLRSAYSLSKCALELKPDGSCYLGSVSMGYGFLPSYFSRIARQLKLSVQIQSSAFYEYRYHVLISKSPV